MKNTNSENLSLNTRLALGFAGLAMLGFFMATVGGPLGAAVYLPLLSVFPILLALQGGNPLAKLFSTRSSRSAHTAGNTHAHV